MRVRAALSLTAVLLAMAAGACGGDDESQESGQGTGDDTPAEVFPEGGSAPEGGDAPLERAAGEAGCKLETTPSSGDDDRLHTTSLDERVDYRSNPPTLGRHYELPAEDGLYQEAPPDEALVHTMEHGRVIVWAKPSLSRDARAALRAFFDEDDYQLVLTPRAEMPYAVAATAWNRDPQPGGTGRTLGCPEWNERVMAVLVAFRDEHRGRGPEAIP